MPEMTRESDAASPALVPGSQPTCGGRTKAADPCPIPPTESSGFAWCFRHDPANASRVSQWASEASRARDGNVGRRVRRMLKRARLDDLDSVMDTRRALWRISAATLIPVDRFRALDSTLADFTAYYLERERRRPEGQALEVIVQRYAEPTP